MAHTSKERGPLEACDCGSCLEGADGNVAGVLILGPGEAKGVLKQRLEKHNGRIVGIETIDKITDHQIAAKVWQHFSERSARGPRSTRGASRTRVTTAAST